MIIIQHYISDILIIFFFAFGFYLFKKKSTILNGQLDINFKGKKKEERGDIQKLESVNDYNNIIETLDPQLIDHPYYIFDMMMKRGINPNLETYNILLYLFILGGKNSQRHYEIIEKDLFDKSKNITIDPDVSTLEIIVKAFEESLLKSNFEYGVDFLYEINYVISELNSRQVKIPSNMLNKIILFTTTALPNDTIRLYNRLKYIISPNQETFLILVNSLLNNQSKDNENKIKTLFYEAGDFNNCISHDLIEVTINFFLSNQKINYVEEIFIYLKQNHQFYLNENLYIKLIIFYGNNMNLERCLQIFDMLKKDINNKCLYDLTYSRYPSIDSYCSTINSCISLKNFEKAENLIEEYEKNVKINMSQFYSSLIRIYKQCRNIKKGEVVINKVKKYFNSTQNALLYNSIIDYYIDINKYNTAFEIYSSLSLSNRDFHSLSLELKLFAKMNNLKKVIEIYNTLLYKVNDYPKLDISILNIVLDCFVKLNDEDICIKIIKDIEEQHINFNIVTYGIIIKLYVSLSNKEKIMFYFNQLSKSNSYGLRPSIIIYQLVIKGLLKLGDIEESIKVFNLLLIEKNIKPDTLIYELIIKGCLEYNYIEYVLEILESAKKLNVKIEDYIIDKIYTYIQFKVNVDISKIFFTERLLKIICYSNESRIKVGTHIVNKIKAFYSKLKYINKSFSMNINNNVYTKDSDMLLINERELVEFNENEDYFNFYENRKNYYRQLMTIESNNDSWNYNNSIYQ